MNINMKLMGLGLVLFMVSMVMGNGMISGELGFKLDASYYTFRHDLRLCSPPMCGGYILQEINYEGVAKEIYVSKMIFDHSSNTRINESMVTDAEGNSVIIRGIFQKNAMNGNFKDLVVLDYFKALPLPNGYTDLSAYKSTGALPSRFYRVDLSRHDVSQHTFTEIHTLVSVDAVYSADVYRDNVALFDTQWYESRLYDSQDPDTRTIVQAYTDSNGNVNVVRAFVHLPDPKEECEQDTKGFKCKAANHQVAAYVRDENRCIVFDQCVVKGPCPLYVPHCPQGYVQSQWASAPKGCPTYKCDADFLDLTPSPFPIIH